MRGRGAVCACARVSIGMEGSIGSLHSHSLLDTMTRMARVTNRRPRMAGLVMAAGAALALLVLPLQPALADEHKGRPFSRLQAATGTTTAATTADGIKDKAAAATAAATTTTAAAASTGTGALAGTAAGARARKGGWGVLSVGRSDRQSH